MELIIKNMSKKIKGKIILNNVNLTLESGNIYAFVGENGAGKTMLFRAASGLMKLSDGSVYLDDKKLHHDFEILPNLGIMLENAGLYPELSGYENLKLLAKIRGRVGKEEIIEWIKKVGLNPFDKKIFRKYSLGMKQRLIFAQALMEAPDILMLDEPTNALDSNGMDTIRKLIMEEKDRGTLVMIASHNTEDIKIMADEVYLVKNGCVTLEDNDYEN